MCGSTVGKRENALDGADHSGVVTCTALKEVTETLS